MRHIPFGALPPAERQALAAALQRSGLPLHRVCVSWLEPASAAEGASVATVTAPGWTRSYATVAGWIALLERDLIALRPRARQAQSGLPKQGDQA